MPFKQIPRGYQVWQGMKQRCLNPNYKPYKHYGGRGVVVCDRWLNSFANFIEDMGEPPEGMTLDRIDNDGNYTPENCRWATRKQQMRNQTVTRRVVIEDVEYIAADLADLAGFKTDVIVERAERGLSYKEVISKERIRHNMSDENKAAIRAGQIKRQKSLTHCRYGHEYNEKNTQITKDGWRRCRICHREREARRRAGS